MGDRRTIFGLVALILVGCGGGTGGRDGRCPAGDHWANPDGRGGRCVSDQSTCNDAAICPQPDTECCAAACADPNGLGVYGCVQNCSQPECTVGSCGVGLECQVMDACEAFCVPEDTDCPAGTRPADPLGNGQWICARDDSECLRPADCAGFAVDPCCGAYCGDDDGDGRYTCAESCAGAADEPAAPADACMRSTDEDCELQNAPGWTCVVDNGCFGGCYCVAPPDCDCAVGAYVPVCGTDGLTYDAACGDSCVPVEIACRNECPCA